MRIRERVDTHTKRRRLSAPTVDAARRLVVAELEGRGFEARVAGHACVLAGWPGSRTAPVHIKAVYFPPWYFRSAGVERVHGDGLTVFVLLDWRRNARSARFFIVKNHDLARRFRQQASWTSLCSIELTDLQKYEDNWASVKE
jgi:hypothetical protein